MSQFLQIIKQVMINKYYKSQQKYLQNSEIMFNGVPNFDNINQLKEAYDAIYQENSSYRQSLLVSPHCSKFDRISYSPHCQNPNYSQSNCFNEYLQSNTKDDLNKTQMKPKIKKRNQNIVDHRKKTEPEEDTYSYKTKQNSLQNCILQLRNSIKQKDQRILLLQKNLAKLTSKSIIFPTQPSVAASPQIDKQLNSIYLSQQVEESPPKFSVKKQKHIKNLYEQEICQKYATSNIQIQNYKKQIRFLTHNNQDLFEQLQKIGEYCNKLQKTLNSTILYTRELQQKINQISNANRKLKQLNNELLDEKKQMMKNYDEQLHLFKKMRKIWDKDQQARGEGNKKNKSKERQKLYSSKQKGKRSKSIKNLK